MNLTTRFLIERYRGLVGWSIGLTAYSVLVVSLFPLIRDSPAFGAALDDYPEGLKELLGGDAGFDLTSGPGFLGAELYYLILPLLLAVVAIGYGASFGAEQENGLVDLILANPIPRRRLVLERALAIAVAVVILILVVVVAVLVSGAIVELGVGLGNLIAASAAVVLLVLVHGMAALAAAAIGGRRSIAVGVATVLFAAGYLLNVGAGFVGWLEPINRLSPYAQATGSSPLSNGWAPVDLLVMAVEAAVLLAVAIVGFDRRDLA